jgi:hypothetical protein
LNFEPTSFGLQAGLVFERIHLRHGPFHEQKNDAFGLGRKMARFGREWRGGRRGGGLGRPLPQQGGQGDLTETGRGGSQQRTPGGKIRLCEDVWI